MADRIIETPVRQIEQEHLNTNYVASLGADAENIQITLEKEGTIIQQCSLLDFFENWVDFKENNSFMYYGDLTKTQADSLPKQVKFWYGKQTTTS